MVNQLTLSLNHESWLSEVCVHPMEIGEYSNFLQQFQRICKKLKIGKRCKLPHRCGSGAVMMGLQYWEG